MSHCTDCPGSGDAMLTRADLIILGGGCAGLSLATRLAGWGLDCPRIALIERRVDYGHDRTWSYWRTPGARLTHLAGREWTAVSVTAAGRKVSVDCREMPYQVIASSDFYAEAWRRIRANPRIDCFLGEEVTTPPQREAGEWRVATARGEWRGETIIDTRPPTNDSAVPPRLWQSFSGVEVECPDGTFADHEATLMDFEPDSSGAISFLYLLPYSTCRALVEATVFSPERRSDAEMQPLLARVLARATADRPYQLGRHEHHAIPMGGGGEASSLGEGHVRVGLHAGAARAATGYAFQRIQRWADAAADAAARGRAIPSIARDPWIIRRMDSLFLRVLARAPERAPGLFLRLFARPDPRPVLRFLSDEARPADYLKVIRSLPAGPFLREALRGFLP